MAAPWSRGVPMDGPQWREAGPYRVLIYNQERYPGLADALTGLTRRLAEGPRELLQGGRHQTYRLALACGDKTLDVVVKRFGRQSALKDRMDALRHGTKAARTYFAAAFLDGNGIGTTPPLAVLERREGQCLVESLFVSFYMPATISLKDVLLHLWYEKPDADDLRTVMRLTATAIRRLHDAGCRHGDLGNQNILLCDNAATPLEERAVAFIDLNRARFGCTLTLWERARDISRVTLPAAFLKTFFEMYWEDAVPRRFLLAEALCRFGFALHTMTRLVRHPIREARYRLRSPGRDAPQHAVYPHGRDLWLWDAATDRPLVIGTPCFRRLHKPFLDGLRRLGCNLAAVPAVLHAGRTHPPSTDEAPPPSAVIAEVVLMMDGLAEHFGRDADLARLLGVRQIFLPFFHHEDAARRRIRLEVARSWSNAGFRLAGSLVQSRRAVREPWEWWNFCDMVLAELGTRLEWVEAGHAIDDEAWGLWGLGEYRRMMDGLEHLAGSWTRNGLVAPSVSLLNLGALLPFLSRLPPQLRGGPVMLRIPSSTALPTPGEIKGRLAKASALIRHAGRSGNQASLSPILGGFTANIACLGALAAARSSGLARACVLRVPADANAREYLRENFRKTVFSSAAEPATPQSADAPADPPGDVS